MCVVLALVLIFFVATPSGRTIWNNWWHDVEKADDNTSYENRKMVQDTCLRHELLHRRQIVRAGGKMQDTFRLDRLHHPAAVIGV